VKDYLDRTYIAYSGDECFDIEFIVYGSDSDLKEILRWLWDEQYLPLYVCKNCQRVYFIPK